VRWGKIGKSFKRAAKVVRKAAKATGKGISKAAKATGKGIAKGAKATGKGIGKAAKATAKVATVAGKGFVKGMEEAGKFTAKWTEEFGKFTAKLAEKFAQYMGFISSGDVNQAEIEIYLNLLDKDAVSYPSYSGTCGKGEGIVVTEDQRFCGAKEGKVDTDRSGLITDEKTCREVAMKYYAREHPEVHEGGEFLRFGRDFKKTTPIGDLNRYLLEKVPLRSKYKQKPIDEYTEMVEMPKTKFQKWKPYKGAYKKDGHKPRDAPNGCFVYENKFYFNNKKFNKEARCFHAGEKRKPPLYPNTCLCKPKCKPCIGMTYNGARFHKNECLKCPPGNFTILDSGERNVGCTRGKRCPPGHYHDMSRRFCIPCPKGMFSFKGDSGGWQSFCVACPFGETTRRIGTEGGKDACLPKPAYRAQLAREKRAAKKAETTVKDLTKLRGITTQIVSVVDASDTTKAKLARNIAEANIQATYNRQQSNRLRSDMKAEMTYCERQRTPVGEKKEDKGSAMGMVVFPTVHMEEERDSTACLNINRDMAVNAYCNFRQDFDEVLRAFGLYNDTTASGKAFWPNICCASVKDDCIHTNGIAQTEMIPFVLAQGGKLTPESLRGELYNMLGSHSQNSIRSDGHLLNGMKAALQYVTRTTGLGVTKVNAAFVQLFENLNLCGPRILKSPKNEEAHLCELFYAYPHMMQSFLSQFKGLLEAKDNGANGTPLQSNSHGRKLLTDPSHREAVAVINAILQKVDKMEKSGQALREENREIRAKIEAKATKQKAVLEKVEKSDQELQKVKKSNQALREENREIRAKIEAKATKQKAVLEKVEKSDQALRKENREIRAKIEAMTNLTHGGQADVGRKEKIQKKKQQGCPKSLKRKFETKEELNKMQNHFCTEYGLDLAHKDIVNVAMAYIEDNLQTKEKGGARVQEVYRRRISENIKYSVTDQCHFAPMFTTEDISIQQIEKMDAKPTDKLKKEWVMLIALDVDNEKGYLKRELQNGKCSNVDYLPQTEIGLQLYSDTNGCCHGTRSYDECSDMGCGLTRVQHHWRDQSLSFKLVVTGTTFRFLLHESLLEGTKFTSPSKTNHMKLGEDVNSGDVTNADSKGTSLLEMSSPAPTSLLDSFKASVTGNCAGFDGKVLFKNVGVDAEKKFTFSCKLSPNLCRCITVNKAENKKTVFSNGNVKFVLEGDGQYVSYEYDVRQRRRRILGRTRMQRFRGGGGS
jgi:hypothetical protein